MYAIGMREHVEIFGNGGQELPRQPCGKKKKKKKKKSWDGTKKNVTEQNEPKSEKNSLINSPSNDARITPT
jgi:hypothetical protein